MDWFCWILVGIMGLCWGSFLNVLIIRTLTQESIIFPPSKCPHCGNLLLWWQKIPIISYYILKGKCNFCSFPISIQYPIIELAGMIIFIFAFIANVSKVDAISVIMILSMFLVLSYTDMKSKKIHPIQTYIIMIAGIIFNRYDIINSLIGGIMGAGVISLFMILGLKFFDRETFGVGDILLFGALGCVVGFDKLYIFMLYALLIEFILIMPKYIINLIRLQQLETLKYLILFCGTCLFLYFLKSISFFGVKVVLLGVLISMLYFGLKLTKNIIYLLKNAEIQSYCPLAPAIALSCLFFLC